MRGLARLSRLCRSKGVRFGIGLSPFEIYRSFDSEAKAALVRLHARETAAREEPEHRREERLMRLVDWYRAALAMCRSSIARTSVDPRAATPIGGTRIGPEGGFAPAISRSSNAFASSPRRTGYLVPSLLLQLWIAASLSNRSMPTTCKPRAE